jgi:uncharacterized protein YjeT (DUF2065 family)
MKECVGLLMIGEGIVVAVRPHGYARLWEHGPEWWQRIIRPFVRNPEMTRLIGVTEAAVGFWLASRQLSERSMA